MTIVINTSLIDYRKIVTMIIVATILMLTKIIYFCIDNVSYDNIINKTVIMSKGNNDYEIDNSNRI